MESQSPGLYKIRFLSDADLNDVPEIYRVKDNNTGRIYDIRDMS